MSLHLHTRPPSPRAAWALEQAGAHPLLARLYAARGVQQPEEIDDALTRLLPPTGAAGLQGATEAARLLADAIERQQRICIVADYDCDGATACATALRGLRMLGAEHLDYLVPDRVTDGYGLTPAIAQRVAQRNADLLLTVDNGIASVEGVQAALDAGLQVLITDHHLPGPALPPAPVIVNPNQPGCPFPGKHLAGVGVMFYVLLALRAELRQRGRISAATQPRLDTLLPLVALGTVADVVKLDANNRRLVAQGLRRIRTGHMPCGLAALFEVAGRAWPQASAADFGFALGPRINAAGRLADMTLGIELLLTDDPARAETLARQLDAINRERRDIENGMREQALLHIENLLQAPPEDDPAALPAAISLHDESFHEGVVGIVASRLKDVWHRPVFVFATSAAAGKSGELKGSGRSIPGFHLRDALDLVAKRCPGALLKFGGHAMAAGCTIARERFDDFQRAFGQVAAELLDEATLTRRLETDGPLPPEYCNADTAELLQTQIWGQGFPPPLFCDEVQVISQRLAAEKHLSLRLRLGEQLISAIWFNRTDPLPPRPRLAYRLQADEWQGQRRVRFIIEAAEELAEETSEKIAE